jgi:nicotinamide-nucleotide amidase
MKNKNDLKIEIMAVGSELLTPHFQDTNSLYLTQRLNDLAMEVSFKTIVGDDWDDLTQRIQESLHHADIIIAMGGLGPTRDDITREAFATVLERKLIFKEALLKKIEARFKRRRLSMPLVNKRQAYIIDGAQVLENKNGTAPGLWLDRKEQAIILLPGPPQELKPMFEASVWPRLQKLRTNHVARRILKTAGLTESKIESLIFDVYPKAPYLKLTTLAYPGQIEIHMTGHSKESQGQAERRVKKLENTIISRLKDNVFSMSGEELEEVVGKLLRLNKKTLSAAESCTGGFLGHRITNVPGSSEYFAESVVAYSNEAKKKLLDISLNLIEKYGAVSSQVAQAMARAIKEKARTSYGLAISGIAGPTGGTPEKPVGLVYTALAWDKGSKVSKNLFLGNREAIKLQSSQKALDMLRRHLLAAQMKSSAITG